MDHGKDELDAEVSSAFVGSENSAFGGYRKGSGLTPGPGSKYGNMDTPRQERQPPTTGFMSVSTPTTKSGQNLTTPAKSSARARPARDSSCLGPCFARAYPNAP